MGPPAWCARHYITLTGLNSWKNVPTIKSDQDSDLIGVRIPQTQDAGEEKGATQIDELAFQDSQEMNYGSKFRKKSPSLKLRRG